MRLVYNGPFEEIEIPAHRLIVKRGEPFDDLTGDDAKALLEQTDFERAPAEDHAGE